MTARRPLTLVSGAVRELPTGDYLAGTITGVGARNLLINGGMLFNQRALSATSTDGAFARDRWVVLNSAASTNILVVGDTPAPGGFVRSMKFSVPTAKGSIAAGDYMGMAQAIEGWNFGIARFGTAFAQPVTISFWVSSSLTGTYACTLRNNSAPYRSYVATFTVDVAGTWEYKTITIPGDTTGTWTADGTAGAAVFFTLAVGSTFQSPTANAWATGNYIGHASQTNFCASTANTLHVTGFQLEVGAFATPFEYRMLSLEEMLCRRYYQNVYSSARFWATAAGQIGQCHVNFIPPMRAAPTLVNISTGGSGNVSAYNGSTIAEGVRYDLNSAAAGDCYMLFRNDGASAEM